jgi:endonuclease-3
MKSRQEVDRMKKPSAVDSSKSSRAKSRDAGADDGRASKQGTGRTRAKQVDMSKRGSSSYAAGSASGHTSDRGSGRTSSRISDAKSLSLARAPKETARRKTPRAKRAVEAEGALPAGADPKRVSVILEKLDEAYPNVTCALEHRDAFQLLIATILSAQTTDVRVNEVTRSLFPQYPTPESFAYANPAELQAAVRPTGFFRNKAKSIMAASKRIVEEFGGAVPRTMEGLLTLAGVARKTANVVLGTAFGIASGVVVDTHVMRISARLDLTRHTEPVKIEQDLMRIIPKEKWILFSHQVIWHGRRVCVARKPRCIECNLERICYAKDKTI